MKGEGRQGGSKIFYGWWIVMVAGLGLFLCYSPIIVYTFGVFLKSVSQEFNWSRAEISLALSLSLVVMSVAFPMIGRQVDRFGARKVIITAALIFGLTLMSFYFLSASLLHFYAIYLVLGVVGGATGSVAYFSVISRWFDKRRGLAMGLAMVGVGLGSIFTPPLAQALIVAVGWRGAYMVMGLTVIVLTIPAVSLFLKETPQIMGLLPDGEQVGQAGTRRKDLEQQGMSCREALRTGTFWLMCGAFFLVSASINGCLVHLVPMLTDRGISDQNAAFAISLLGGASLLGRVGTGYLLDRFLASHVAVCLFCGAALGVFLLRVEVSGRLAFFASFLVGLGLGAEGDIMAYLVSRYFGLRAFGEIYGYILGLYTLGAVIGPILMGIDFDFRGSYRLVLGVFSLLTLIGAMLMAQLGPYQILEKVAIPVKEAY